MVDIRTAPDAVATFESWQTYPARACLNAMSRLYQRGDATHVSEINPILNVSDATTHWNKTDPQYKHADDLNAPAGSLYQCTGGQGHIFLALGNHRARSTDYPYVGHIGEDSVENILKHFSGNPYAGYVTAINGRPIQGLVYDTPPAPAPAPATGAYAINLPSSAIQRRIQVALKRKGRYNGPLDGAIGVNGWKGIQQSVSKEHGANYDGPIDGIPGYNTCLNIQVYAKKWGGYKGPLDAILGPNSWLGFTQGVEAP